MATSDTTNPYEPPKASLDVGAPVGSTASLDDAVAGRYDFDIGQVMSEAWDLCVGMRKPFWGAAIVIGLIALVVDLVLGIGVGFFLPERPHFLVKPIFNGAVGALMTPFTLGLQMMCVRRALGLPVSFSTAFNYFSKAGTAVTAGLLVFILTYAGLAFFVVPGVYLAGAYTLTTQLIGEHEMSAWRAMETSRRALTHRWFRALGLSAAVALFVALSALMVLIPLIWTVPWAMMVTGVLYGRVFHGTTAPAPAPFKPAPPANS